MQPGAADLTIYQGDDFIYIFRLRTAILDVDGVTWIPSTYMDLTGYTLLKAQIRATEASATVIEEFTCALLTQSGATLGGVSIFASKTDTAALVPNNGIGSLPVWDFQMTDTATHQATYLKGKVTILPEVTR